MKMRLGVSLVLLMGVALLTGCYGGHGDSLGGGHGSGHKGKGHGMGASMYEIQSVQAGETPVAFVLNKLTGEVQAVSCNAAGGQLSCKKSNMVNFDSAVLSAAHPDMSDEDE